MRYLLLAATAATLISCGDSTGSGPNLSGNWQGLGGGGSWTLSMTDNGGQLTGSCTVAAGAWVGNCFFSGTRSGANVTLTYTMAGFVPARFTGEATSPTRLFGVLTESGFNGDAMQLNKQ